MHPSWGTHHVRDYLPLQQGLRRCHHFRFRQSRRRQRLSSTTTRIKTIFSLKISLKKKIVRDYLPLQQGLRHSTPAGLVVTRARQRLSSTTTRIKTSYFIGKSIIYWNRQRLSSTTTRIKTVLGATQWSICKERQRLSSTTTRIKTSVQLLCASSALIVRDYLPLQQGLRLFERDGCPVHSAGQRLSSTTTRIKTGASIVFSYLILSKSETIFHYNKD